MSIFSRNFFYSTYYPSSRHSNSTEKRNIVPPWRGVIHYRTIFDSRSHRREIIARSLLSHDANSGRNLTKPPKWEQEQTKENSKYSHDEKKQELKMEFTEAESTDAYKFGEWALQPDLTVKRDGHLHGRTLEQLKLAEKIDVPGYYYNSLHDAIIEGNLNVILGFLESSLEAAQTKITERKETVFHVAIAATRTNRTFIEKLLEHIPQEALFSVNNEGETPLHYAAAYRNLEAAQFLVQKCQELPNLRDNQFQYPIHHAAKNGHRELISYLMDMTQGLSSLEYTMKAQLLNYLIQSSLCGLPMRRMKEVKQINKSAHELLKCFCSEISQINSKEALETVHKAALSASEFGNPEVIKQLFFSFPGILAREEILLNIFHHAIVNRHSNVFNLLLQMNQRKKLSAQVLDEYGNNILHLTAKLPPQRKLNLDSAPALTMQQELQWFKAVESITSPYTSSLENKEKMTPAAVFTIEHAEMLKQAKVSMNNMAYSGTTIATLFTTMAFSAATAVPGGNNIAGYPIFSDTTAFAVFAISDAISLFLSIASMMMFFSFFTARYEEQDFLTALPRKLEIGRTMLFFSTISMMVTFGSVFFIVLAGHRKPSMIAPVILSSLVPVLLFTIYHIPSLVERIKCAFRPGALH